MTIDMHDVSTEIRRVSTRLDGVPKAVFNAAKDFAEAEREYRKALSIEIVKLRTDGMPVSIISDVARGNVADLKFKRDLAEGQYRSCMESAKSLQSEMSGLQSILRVQDNV
ncbi:hypothetical protein [Brevibacillus centrosporus]|uniref:hypothetical protein n=1 Tax=Brevibacillus centrosporus TaxID=54910 RepID=UPI002E1EF29B|nr:hypothetical protein [Brevibacillus centrosporus]